MLASLSPTEVSFLTAALIQAVASAVWAIGALAVPEERRPMAHWAAWAALSSVTWLTLATQIESPPLFGIACGMLGAMTLQRGIRVHIGRPPALLVPGALLALVLVVNRLGADPAHRSLAAAINFGVLACLYFGMARDLYVHGRDDLRLRWPLLLALPVLLGALAFGSRALRAWVSPASVQAEMITHSALNVASVLGYLVLVLLLHATLMALVTGRLVNDLRRLSRHDGLTGLLNRRALEEALAAQVQRSRRSGEPFCVLMLDADHFKAINDCFGHAVGDQALKHLSGLLLGHMRAVDRLARFGGEEFLVLLPGLTLSAALPVAERLRELVASAPLPHAGSNIALSVSIGMAEWGGAPEEMSRLLVRVDAALYEAKQHGRDRVAAAGLDALPT
jgi:diguanylate cyclase (GGDEF)-like protein